MFVQSVCLNKKKDEVTNQALKETAEEMNEAGLLNFFNIFS
jgi:hypothetical protein